VRCPNSSATGKEYPTRPAHFGSCDFSALQEPKIAVLFRGDKGSRSAEVTDFSTERPNFSTDPLLTLGKVFFCGDKESRLVELIDFSTERPNFTTDPLLKPGTAVSFSGCTSKEAVCNRSSLLVPVIGSPIGEPVRGAEPLATLVGVKVVESGAAAVEDGEEART
jgi:hypothetical protein